MSKSETSNSNGGPSFQAPRYRPNWLAAVALFFASAYLSAALLSYNVAEVGSPFRSTEATAKNLMGWIGADTVWVLLYAFGVSAWLAPLLLFWLLYLAIRSSKHRSEEHTSELQSPMD